MNLNDEIKNSLDIVDIIGERVKLKRAGRGFVGLCPFHGEKTPSFHVYPDTQSYYCFGCQAAGDIFTFVMKIDGLSFSEALGLLAARAGIRISKRESKNAGEKSAYEILDMAAKFFTENLTSVKGSVARAYMQRRGMDSDDIEKFSLGYSLNSWDSLTNYLRRLGVKDRELLNTGLSIQSPRGIYDRFRGRLIFPVRDVAGRVIAFGGRLIDGEGAKYINSPESEIYSKRKNLYLLHEARKFIKEKNRSLLVEGYMDALRLHKCGFGEAVASLGTSLTAEQADLLARFSSRCYICYDSDAAGQNATLRGMYILQEHGLDVHVVSIPEGKDPDEFLSTNPPEDFEKEISNSAPLVLQQIKALAPAIKNPETQKQATKELFAELSKSTVNEVMPYSALISSLTRIPPSEILNLIAGNSRIKNFMPTPSEEIISGSDDEKLEAALCALLFNHEECRFSIDPEEIYKLLSNKLARDVAMSIMTENPDTLTSLWLTTGDTDKISLIKRGEELCRTYYAGNEIDFMWQAIYNRIKQKYLERRFNELQTKFNQNVATDAEFQELNELRNLKF